MMRTATNATAIPHIIPIDKCLVGSVESSLDEDCDIDEELFVKEGDMIVLISELEPSTKEH